MESNPGDRRERIRGLELKHLDWLEPFAAEDPFIGPYNPFEGFA